jgi:hypothetical protein
MILRYRFFLILSLLTFSLSAGLTAQGLVLDVRDYGTLGTADDTAVFQAAIDAGAALSTKARVESPCGQFNVDTIQLKSLVDFFGQGLCTKFVAISGATGGVFELFDENVERVNFGNFWIEGNKNVATVTGVLLDSDGGDWTGADPEIKLTDIMVTNVGVDGFRFVGSRSLHGLRLRVRNPTQDGFSLLPGATDSTADGIFVDLSSEASGRDLLHIENAAANIFVGFKGGGLDSRYGVFVDSNSFDLTFSGFTVDGDTDTLYRIEGHNNVFSGCNGQDGSGAAIVFASTGDRNTFTGFVWTRGGTPITTHAVDLQSGATGNHVTATAENLTTGAYTVGSDITNNTLIYNGKLQVPSTSRLLGRASSGAGDVETIQLGAGLSFSGTTLTGAFSGTGVCGANTWISTLNTGAAPTCTQPGFTNLSGTLANTQLPVPLLVDGASDAVQATIQGHSTQTSPIFTIEKSDGADAFNVYNSGKIEVPLLHNAGGTGSTAAIASGSFSTSCAALINVAAVINRTGQWIRVGQVFTASGACDIDPTAGSTHTVFVINLPITSGLTLLGDCAGTTGYTTGTTSVIGFIKPDITGDRAQAEFDADAGAGSQTHHWHFTCQVK